MQERSPGILTGDRRRYNRHRGATTSNAGASMSQFDAQARSVKRYDGFCFPKLIAAAGAS